VLPMERTARGAFPELTGLYLGSEICKITVHLDMRLIFGSRICPGRGGGHKWRVHVENTHRRKVQNADLIIGASI
jgi:hypothetical protein